MSEFSPTRFRLALFSIVVGIALLGWVGCDSAGTNPRSEDSGTASFDVRLTDAPGDVVQAIVTIERVAVVPTDAPSDGGAREGGIMLLSDSAFTADPVNSRLG